jgi:hypothetical protein
MENRLNEGDQRFEDIEQEIESLKKWRWTLTGAAAAIGFVASKAWEWFAGAGGPPGKH